MACTNTVVPDASLDSEVDLGTDASLDEAVVILDGSSVDDMNVPDSTTDTALDTASDLEIPDMEVPANCTAMDVMQVGFCRPIRGYYWNGGACVLLSGCSCAGDDCENVFPTTEACDLAYPDCPRNRI